MLVEDDCTDFARSITYYLLCLAFPFATSTVDGTDVVAEAKDEESVKHTSAEEKPADCIAAKEV